jgi:hypothetical protein
MNRPFALLLLLLTLVPLGDMVYFIAFPDFPRPTSSAEARAQIELMFRVQAGVIIECWVLVAAYIVYVFKTRHVPAEKRALWAAVLFFGNFIAMPVFWFLYVWRPLRSPHAAA